MATRRRRKVLHRHAISPGQQQRTYRQSVMLVGFILSLWALETNNSEQRIIGT